MKALVIYFSWTGNNRYLATELASRLDADLAAVIEKRKRTGATTFLDMLFRRMPEVEPLAHDPADYDHVVLVAPIWVAHVASPMVAMLRRIKTSLPDYSFICLCGDDRDKQAAIVSRQLTRITGRAPNALAQLPVSKRVPHAQEDIRHFDAGIREFCSAINASDELPLRAYETPPEARPPV